MSTPQLVVTTRVLDDARDLLQIPPRPDAGIWLSPGLSLVAWGNAASLAHGLGADRFDRAGAAFADLSSRAHVDDAVGVTGGGLLALGSFTFDADEAGSTLVVPRRIVGRAAGRTWLTRIDGPHLSSVVDEPTPPTTRRPEPDHDRVRFAGSSMPDVDWLEAVATAIKEIETGTLEKVVLARDHAVWSKRPFDPLWLAGRLARRFPACFTFHVGGLIGATPELLVRRDGDAVASLALAGSTSRGATDAEDRDLGARLLASDKDRREHAHAARSVTDALRGICRDLHVTEPFLRRLDNVQHLATEVTGTLADPTWTALALAGRLHPTAAVGGTPRTAAVEAIRRLEGMQRGCYAGPVGWVAANGDGEFGIALRCAELSGARARLFAGAGIVRGSLPEDELEETRIKLRAMQGALGT